MRPLHRENRIHSITQKDSQVKCKRASQDRRDLLWTPGGPVYPEEGLDLEVAVEPVTLPILADTKRLAWEYELRCKR